MRSGFFTGVGRLYRDFFINNGGDRQAQTWCGLRRRIPGGVSRQKAVQTCPTLPTSCILFFLCSAHFRFSTQKDEREKIPSAFPSPIFHPFSSSTLLTDFINSQSQKWVPRTSIILERFDLWASEPARVPLQIVRGPLAGQDVFVDKVSFVKRTHVEDSASSILLEHPPQFLRLGTIRGWGIESRCTRCWR